MGKLKLGRIGAATLVETIVAMLIILVITSITITILVQVTSTGYSIKNLKATSLIDRCISDINSGKELIDDEIIEDGLKIKKEVIETNHSLNITTLRISIYDQDDKLLKYRNYLLVSK